MGQCTVFNIFIEILQIRMWPINGAGYWSNGVGRYTLALAGDTYKSGAVGDIEMTGVPLFWLYSVLSSVARLRFSHSECLQEKKPQNNHDLYPTLSMAFPFVSVPDLHSLLGDLNK